LIEKLTKEQKRLVSVRGTGYMCISQCYGEFSTTWRW